MQAQRSLGLNQRALSQSMERLSSGLRINSAKDDAAGLSIATRMTNQIQGTTVAIRNTNDGLSITQTAEGAMNEMTANVIRAKDLAVQASNYNNNTDRGTLDTEVQSILTEMNRTVNQSTYNGSRLLDGTFRGDIQVGTEVNQNVNITIGNLSTNQMGVATNYTAISGLSTQGLADNIGNSYRNALFSSTVDGSAVGNVAANSNSALKIESLNALSTTNGTIAFSYGNGSVGAAYTAAGTTAAVADGIASGALSINGVTIGTAAAAASDGLVATNLAAAINAVSSQTGVTASIVADLVTPANSSIVLTNTDGAEINVVANSSIDAGISTFFSTNTVGAHENGAIVLNDSLNDLTVAFNGTTTGMALTGACSASSTLVNSTLGSQSVSTAASANLSMLVFDASLNTINTQRADLGALSNRFEAIGNNLEVMKESITAARGRIMDTDFAEETAAMTKRSVLAQAAMAMVSQANQTPQQVLALLR
jgi:flagellin